MSSPALTLYVWPSKWDLPSFETECLSTLLYLQLAIPDRFSVVESANPDHSPTGQLPYLTHGHHVVASYSSIVKYVTGLSPSALPYAYRNNSVSEPDIFSTDLDILLSLSERAHRTAWAAHVQSTLGDLVAHVLYSLPENFNTLTHPTLVSLFSIPQRYYVPARIRQTYQARLDASGLWALAGEEIEDTAAEQPKFPREKKPSQPPLDKAKVWKTAFFRERVLERARDALEPYARLLGENKFFFYDRPTSLDVLLAARILLLTAPPFPDPLLGELVRVSFPSLLNHAHAVLDTAFPRRPFAANYHALPFEIYSLRSLLPPLDAFTGKRKAEEHEKTKEEKEIEQRYTRGRWLFVGMSIAASVWYLASVPGLISALTIQQDPIEEPEEYDEEEEEEEEEEGGNGEGKKA
ncbi:hypothetical protein OF83DRAFT_1161721 [Amylostereum chailletii]|nr:hypothetical protein OF83DRAFT_1161721 [Amylostereum chailletii]